MSSNKAKGKFRVWKMLVIIIVVAVVIVIVGISNFLVSYAIGRAGDGGNREVALEVEETATDIEKIINENRNLQIAANDAFVAEVASEQVAITSEDGLALAGTYYKADSHKWVIALHGYRGNGYSGAGLNLAQHYYDAGFQVLAPDLRACGNSEGDYVGMGWLDRKDILGWITWIIEQDPEAEIVVHGISMGAETTMITAGEETPDQVIAFVEDCGYTSVYDVFASELKLRFHLPEVPLMYTASMASKIRAGYFFQEASALKQVANCEKPMMFIHGTLDDFIPFEMEDILYQAKPGDNKQLVVAEGAGHGEAMYAMGEEYWTQVMAFLGQYIDVAYDAPAAPEAAEISEAEAPDPASGIVAVAPAKEVDVNEDELFVTLPYAG